MGFAVVADEVRSAGAALGAGGARTPRDLIEESIASANEGTPDGEQVGATRSRDHRQRRLQVQGPRRRGERGQPPAGAGHRAGGAGHRADGEGHADDGGHRRGERGGQRRAIGAGGDREGDRSLAGNTGGQRRSAFSLRRCLYAPRPGRRRLHRPRHGRRPRSPDSRPARCPPPSRKSRSKTRAPSASSNGMQCRAGPVLRTRQRRKTQVGFVHAPIAQSRYSQLHDHPCDCCDAHTRGRDRCTARRARRQGGTRNPDAARLARRDMGRRKAVRSPSKSDGLPPPAAPCSRSHAR